MNRLSEFSARCILEDFQNARGPTGRSAADRRSAPHYAERTSVTGFNESARSAKREPLLKRGGRRLSLEFAALVPEHGGDELPGGTRCFAPWRGNGDHAVSVRVRVVAEKPEWRGKSSFQSAW